MVSTEKPQNISGYNRYEVDGIEVFVHRNVKSRDGVLKFRLRRFLFIKEIAVDGMKVI